MDLWNLAKGVGTATLGAVLIVGGILWTTGGVQTIQAEVGVKIPDKPIG